MVLVAIAALDFAMIRECVDYENYIGELLAFGGLPMANILVVDLLAGWSRRRSRPYSLGFKAFGATALTLYVVDLLLFRGEVVDLYVGWVLAPFRWVPWLNIDGATLNDIIVRCIIVVVMLTLPQLAFALLGGFLSNRYKIVRREGPARSEHSWDSPCSI